MAWSTRRCRIGRFRSSGSGGGCLRIAQSRTLAGKKTDKFAYPHCICLFDLTHEIVNLDPGIYTVLSRFSPDTSQSPRPRHTEAYKATRGRLRLEVGSDGPLLGQRGVSFRSWRIDRVSRGVPTDSRPFGRMLLKGWEVVVLIVRPTGLLGEKE